MDTPITMSDNYRSGFNVRVKKVNGKIGAVWLEVTTHNEKLDTTLAELSRLVKELGLEGDLNIKAEPEKEKLNVRYYCMKCNYSFPAFPNHPNIASYYCPTCGKWTNFEKK